MSKKKISLDEMGIGSNNGNKVPDAPVETRTRGNDLGMERVAKPRKVTKVNISDIVGVQKKVDPREEAERELMEQLDDNIERTKKELMENVIQPFKEACVAASLSDESDKLNPDKDLEAEIAAIPDSDIRSKVHNTTDQDLEDFLSDDSTESKFDSNTPMRTVEDVRPATFMEDPEEDDELSLKNLESDDEPVFRDEVEEPATETVDDTAEQSSKTEEEEKMNMNEETKVAEVKEPVLKAEKAEEKKDSIVTTPNEVVDAVTNPKAKASQEKISDEDLKEFLDEEGDELTEDEKEELKERQREFRKEVFEKLNIPATIDKSGISKFRIATKPVSVSRILKNSNTKLDSATWALPNSGRLITFSALSGEEIENLNPDAHDSNMSVDMANRLVFNTLYGHLVDSNKPDTMEAWLKTINWFDINDIYFGIYLATFKNSNFVAYGCEKDKCKKIFLKDTNYRDMIKYADEKCEKTYKALFAKANDITPSEIPEDIVPISEKYAIGFRAPSVYDIMFGASSLDREFRAKYATTIGNISYMANIYYILDDTLFPVDCKPVKDSPSKTMRNKIVAYYNILKTLPSDQFSIVTRTIQEINTQNKVMATFHYPDAVCPKCGSKIERAEHEENPLFMLFTRHQLVQSASSMIE